MEVVLLLLVPASNIAGTSSSYIYIYILVEALVVVVGGRKYVGRW